MYNRLSFESKLSQNHLQKHLLQIRQRKSLFPQEHLIAKRRKALSSLMSEKKITQQNQLLVKRILQVKYNPAYVKKMFMGQSLTKSSRIKLSKTQLMRPLKITSKKQKELEQQNKKLQKILSLRNKSKILLKLPQI